MKMKSFFASDANAALGLARRELGPDAMLVETRTAPPECWHLGQCEVVMAIEDEANGSLSSTAAAPTPEVDVRLSAGMAELQRKLERVAAAIAKSSLMNNGDVAATPELAETFAGLLENDVDPQLAHDILERVRGTAAASSRSLIQRYLNQELRKKIRVEARLGRGKGTACVAFVGPCATGKTTTLVKLAVLHGLSNRKPTQILSVDCYRVAAAEQLRSYATILGLGFQALDTPLGLAQALEEHRSKDLILIDTPGYGPKDMDAAVDLAAFLASRDDIDTHLVLTASTKSADLSRVVDRFEIFRPGKLLFTKLDETGTFGPILNEAARTGKPVSYFAAGQQIPDDLEPATTDRIMDLILRREEILAAAA